MKSRYKKLICGLFTVSTLGFTSCKKFVEIDPPINSFIASTAFESDDLVKANIVGIHSYALGTNYLFSLYQYLYSGMTADETTYYSASNDQWVLNDILTSNSTNRSLWTAPYKTIYQCNTMLKELDKATKISAPVMAEGVGTAKFFRAICYLSLISFFGDVPMVLETDVKATTVLPRSPVAQIYELIIKDLVEAKTAFKGLKESPFFANEKSATALLARVYLYEKQWQNAADAATEIINGPLTGDLKLDELNKVFQRVSKETILAIAREGSYQYIVNFGYNGTYYIPDSYTVYPVTPSLYSAFEAGDLRKTNWIGTNTNGGITTHYPFKYKLESEPSNTALAEDQVLIRLGEVYLIRAEALAELGRTSEAIADLNAIRKRAGLKPLANTLGKSEVLLAVEQERRVELFTEGHRWLDLIRTGRADAVLGALKGEHWQTTDKLFPIPSKEIEINHNLTQNPGYDR